MEDRFKVRFWNIVTKKMLYGEQVLNQIPEHLVPLSCTGRRFQDSLIWQADIIEFRSPHEDGSRRGVIAWSDELLTYIIQTNEEEYDELASVIVLKVLGNTYEKETT